MFDRLPITEEDITIQRLVWNAFCVLDQVNDREGEHTNIREIIICIAAASDGHVILTYKQVRDAMYRLRVDCSLPVYHQFMGYYDTYVRAYEI